MQTLGSLIGFIPTKNPKTARAFYETTLGLRFIADDGFAMVFASGANMVRVARAGEFTPAPFTILGWESANLEQDVHAFAERGVVFERYSFLPQDDAGIWTAPTGDKVAWFKDPDGNTLSLSQHPPRTVLSD